MFLPEEARCRCRSSPVIIGMLMSTIRHDEYAKYGEARKSTADAKACTANPADRNRPLSASRTESSSSTMDIWGFVGTPTSGTGRSRETTLRPEHRFDPEDDDVDRQTGKAIIR